MGSLISHRKLMRTLFFFFFAFIYHQSKKNHTLNQNVARATEYSTNLYQNAAVFDTLVTDLKAAAPKIVVDASLPPPFATDGDFHLPKGGKVGAGETRRTRPPHRGYPKIEGKNGFVSVRRRRRVYLRCHRETKHLGGEFTADALETDA